MCTSRSANTPAPIPPPPPPPKMQSSDLASAFDVAARKRRGTSSLRITRTPGAGTAAAGLAIPK
jgi:hypothetical protein